DGDVVLVPQPAYPVYERGAVFAGKQVVELPLRAADGFLPELDAIPADVLARTSILWLNYPNNPTAATAPLDLYERAAALAREHQRLLERGLVLTPGDYFGEAGAGYLRLALVPTLAECERAAEVLASASIRPAP